MGDEAGGTPPQRGGDGRDKQIAALTELLATVAKEVRSLNARVTKLTKQVEGKAVAADLEPAPWVWYTPPAAAEDDPDGDDDPRVTVVNFVAWYNVTFVGADGSRCKPIPPCWQRHPALAMEVAGLAYSWRAANIGPAATARDAQYWLQQWRTGFVDRLARDWVHPDCLDGQHRDGDLRPRPSRFELKARAAAQPPPRPAAPGAGEQSPP